MPLPVYNNDNIIQENVTDFEGPTRRHRYGAMRYDATSYAATRYGSVCIVDCIQIGVCANSFITSCWFVEKRY